MEKSQKEICLKCNGRRSPTRKDTTENTDPRVLRSRQMLMEALLRLLTRKEFDDISIQEIADEATLNRATFYLHYPDKNALLQAMTATRFRDLIARRGLSFTDCDGALRAIALGVCDYLAETTAGCPSQLAKMPLEGSIIPVVEGMFQEGAGEAQGGARSRSQPARNHGSLGHLRRRASLVPDSRPHSRRGNGRQD